MPAENSSQDRVTRALPWDVVNAPFTLSLEQRARCERYAGLLELWNNAINLTTIDEPEQILRRHFVESFLLSRFQFPDGSRLLDIGSGAGFPGLAVKMVLPEIHTTLLEPRKKKAAFLKEVSFQLLLENVEIYPMRLEDYVRLYSGRPFTHVTSRAVGDQRALLETIRSIISNGTQVLFYLTVDQEQTLAGDLPDGFTLEKRVPLSSQSNRCISCFRYSG